MTVFERELPGAELVASGIAALRRDELTVEALLVLAGASRLRAAGLEIPKGPARSAESWEHALYGAIAAEQRRGAHSRYNALIRRLTSFARALERLNGCAGGAARATTSNSRDGGQLPVSNDASSASQAS